MKNYNRYGLIPALAAAASRWGPATNPSGPTTGRRESISPCCNRAATRRTRATPPIRASRSRCCPAEPTNRPCNCGSKVISSVADYPARLCLPHRRRPDHGAGGTRLRTARGRLRRRGGRGLRLHSDPVFPPGLARREGADAHARTASQRAVRPAAERLASGERDRDRGYGRAAPHRHGERQVRAARRVVGPVLRTLFGQEDQTHVQRLRPDARRFPAGRPVVRRTQVLGQNFRRYLDEEERAGRTVYEDYLDGRAIPSKWNRTGFGRIMIQSL